MAHTGQARPGEVPGSVWSPHQERVQKAAAGSGTHQLQLSSAFRSSETQDQDEETQVWTSACKCSEIYIRFDNENYCVLQFKKPLPSETLKSFDNDQEENIYESIDPPSEDYKSLSEFESSCLNLDQFDDYRMINSSRDNILQDNDESADGLSKLVFCFSCLFD